MTQVTNLIIENPFHSFTARADVPESFNLSRPNKDALNRITHALETIRKHAKKYKITKVILFGSSKESKTARDIDIGVKGVNPKVFFKFYWELYRDLSKPVDIIDLDIKSLFTTLVERDGVVIYG